MAKGLPERKNPQPRASPRHTAAPNRFANSTSERPVPAAIGGGAENKGPRCPPAATGVEEFALHPTPTRAVNTTQNRTCSRPVRRIILHPDVGAGRHQHGHVHALVDGKAALIESTRYERDGLCPWEPASHAVVDPKSPTTSPALTPDTRGRLRLLAARSGAGQPGQGPRTSTGSSVR